MTDQVQAKKWLIGFVVATMLMLGIVTGLVVYEDPFFHYHAPLKGYRYWIDNEHSQNDGILKHFDYDALITGTSMIENFNTSELDELFSVRSVKVPYVGETYYFINSQVETALKSQPSCKYVFRCLDQDRFFQEREALRTDQGIYPVYLYNDNPLDDVQYVWNIDILTRYCLPAYRLRLEKDPGGITDFDDYGNWMDVYKAEDFGAAAVLAGHASFTLPVTTRRFTAQDAETVRENITQNVTDIADAYPEVTFYYFFPPYSVAWWGGLYTNGELERQLEAERAVIELLLQHENIRLYSFNTLEEVVLSLVHYKDDTHYGEWINAQMLRYMAEDRFRITADNYEEYLRKEREQFLQFDYEGLFQLPDA